MSGRRQSVFSLLREDAGLTLEEAAELIGCSMRTIYRYESGEVQPRRSAIRLLDNLAEQASRDDDLTSFRFIDLFAGIGGLRLGFESIGGRCVFTSEWDPAAQKTYSMNFRDNHPIAGDIREYSADPDLVPQHDVLLAGFPCQPFSIAGVSKKNSLGRPHGFMCDTQGTLFYDTARIIDYRRPAAFVLENVKNLENHDQGRTFRTVMHVLENELGYNVQHRVINSAAWVPQKRERIFIIGFRDPTDFDFEALELPDSKAGPKLKSILLPDDEVDPKYTLTERLWEYLKDYRQKHSEKGNGFGYSMFGPEDVSRTLSARYYKDGSEILIEQPGGRPRRLTPRECARLMGFERDGRTFKICVSDTQAYRQFGNSVVVPVVEFVARAMEPHIRKALEKKPEAESGGLEVEAA